MGPFYSLWAHNWNLVNFPFTMMINPSHDFCIWHGSSAVKLKKLWPYLTITIHIRATPIFTRFGLWPHKPLVKWIPDWNGAWRSPLLLFHMYANSRDDVFVFKLTGSQVSLGFGGQLISAIQFMQISVTAHETEYETQRILLFCHNPIVL